MFVYRSMDTNDKMFARQQRKTPKILEHGWRVKTVNMSHGDLYGACPNIRITVGDVSDNQNFFIQEYSSYRLILGQPFITALRMETKVLDDGSVYA